MSWQPPFPPRQLRQWIPPPYLGVQPIAPAAAPPPYDGGPTIDLTPQSVEVHPPLTPIKPSLDQIPIRKYSHIVAAQFVEHKLVPKPLVAMADVEYMDWHFDEPEHDEDHEVRVYVSMSPEERAIIIRYGYHHDPLETSVPVFEECDFEQLTLAQKNELAAAGDPHTRAALAIEHKQQLAWAREQKYDITILDYLAQPFRKQFPNRLQATIGQNKINSKLAEFRKKLDNHRAR